MFPKYIFSLLCLIPLCLILLCSIPISCYATFRCASFRYTWFQIAHFNVMTDSCSLLCLIPLCLITLCLIPVLMKPRYAWFRYTRFRCTWFHFCMLCPIPLCQVPPSRCTQCDDAMTTTCQTGIDLTTYSLDPEALQILSRLFLPSLWEWQLRRWTSWIKVPPRICF